MTIQTIMTEDPSGTELVEFARRTAEQLVRAQLNRAQIRTIFTEVRKIETLWDSDPKAALRRLTMLKPKLDYQSVRIPAVEQLKVVLTQAIDQVNQPNLDEKQRERRFHIFMDLFEAILAYHRSLDKRA